MGQDEPFNRLPGNFTKASLQKWQMSARASAALSTHRATILLGCYRKGDAADPDTYVAAIAATLSSFSEEIVHRVTDPVNGLPSQSQFLPTVKEVHDACAAIERRHAQHIEREQRIERQLADREEFEKSRKTRLSIAELKAAYGDWSPVKNKPFDAAAFRDKFGISVEDWNNIPEAPRGTPST